jgi:hypothetical protein
MDEGESTTPGTLTHGFMDSWMERNSFGRGRAAAKKKEERRRKSYIRGRRTLAVAAHVSLAGV